MPIEVTNLQFMFIQPNNPYLAISSDNQHFISYSDIEYNKCTLGVAIKYCALDNMPVCLRSCPSCEIQLLKLSNNNVCYNTGDWLNPHWISAPTTHHGPIDNPQL